MSMQPSMFRVRQHFERPQVDDIPTAVNTELSRLALAERVKPAPAWRSRSAAVVSPTSRSSSKPSSIT